MVCVMVGDHSRVVIGISHKTTGSDYINASSIDVSLSCKYCLCQCILELYGLNAIMYVSTYTFTNLSRSRRAAFSFL